MIEHRCQGKWVPGSLTECGDHRPVRRVVSVAPLAERNNIVVDGVAQTGQVSPKGTVAHREWFDGHVDATARPRPVKGPGLTREQAFGR